MARISRELVRLRKDAPVTMEIEEFAVKKPIPEELLSFLEAQNFKTLASTMGRKLGVAPKPQNNSAGGTPSSNSQGVIPATYELVQDTQALDKWIAEAQKVGIVAVDTETTGLDAMQVDLVGVSLSVTAGSACYIPLSHRNPPVQGTLDLLGDLMRDGETSDSEDQPVQIEKSEALSRLKIILEDPSILKIGQNIKYDMQIFERNGISLQSYDDTMLLSYVLDGGLHGHGMDELARDFLGCETIKFSEVAGKGKSKITFDLVPLDKALDYAAEDAEVTLRLHQRFKPRLAQEQMVTVYETLERPLIGVLRQMEANGILADQSKLKALSADFATKMEVLKVKIYDLVGHEFNIASPKQLGEILFDDMGLPGGKKTKTGAWQTGADVLDDLAAAGHALPVEILAWRHLAKLKSTYTDALIEQINPTTGRVHTSYAQAVASTGRLSSSDPNLQNIPIRTEEGRKIRQAFIAKPGHKLLAADYSQIELRLLAHVANIESLKEAFKSGEDIHAWKSVV